GAGCPGRPGGAEDRRGFPVLSPRAGGGEQRGGGQLGPAHRFPGRREEVVAVNGVDVTNMTREEFKDALKERPLTLRFRVQPEAPRALRAVVAAAEVDKLGLSFSQLPPSPVVVNKVMGWAQIAGFEGGEEIVMLNGKQVSAMSSEEFKAALKERPLDVRFELPEDEAVIEEVTATEEVTKIGLAFDRLPPEPVVVKKVAPGTWADEMGFQRGESEV
ncbi:unnamed protein product, partial [Effrenium voratum]